MVCLWNNPSYKTFKFPPSIEYTDPKLEQPYLLSLSPCLFMHVESTERTQTADCYRCEVSVAFHLFFVLAE
jgi:hypothetical protein